VPDIRDPFGLQNFGSVREGLNRVVHVKNVFGALISAPPPVNQYLLCQETDGICDLHSGFVCERETIVRRQSKVPRRGQQDLNVPQVLRRDAAYVLCCFLPPASGDCTACKVA